MKNFIIDLGEGLPINFKADSRKTVERFLSSCMITWVNIEEV